MANPIPFAEWKKKAEEAYIPNQYSVKQMIRDWGFPSDLDPNKVGFNFQKGKLYQKGVEVRKQTRGDVQRRAAINEQSLTRQDYLDYARKNGYSVEQANQLFEINETKLANYRGQKTADLHYEHLSPSRSPVKGGVEHYRNIVMMQGDLNIDKSDKLASTAALRKAGVPLTKQGALYADFNNLPLPTDQKQIDIILKDIANQSNPKTSRSVRKALSQNPAVEQVGEKFRLVDDLNLTPAQRRQLSKMSLEAKDTFITNLKKAKNLPGLGLVVGGGLATAQLMQGNPAAAAETAFDTAVSEIPIVDTVLEPAPTADATLQGRTDPQAYAAQYKEERKKAKQEQSNFITDTLKLISDAI